MFASDLKATLPDKASEKIVLAMMFAMASVFFERLHDFERALSDGSVSQFIGTVVVGLGMAAVLSDKLRRWAPWIVLLGLIPVLTVRWSTYANHGWLAIWLLFAAPLVKRWWASEDYWTYIRITLGVVMLAACAQKILAGTYLDGSYITYLSYFGGTTERLFGFLCSPEQALASGCFWHRAIGIFLVVWQAVVGLLLIAGFRAPVFLLIEVTFLIGAGLYADEFNFQVLNIAFLIIAFGVGMSRGLAVICSIMLLIDFYSLTRILNHVHFG